MWLDHKNRHILAQRKTSIYTCGQLFCGTHPSPGSITHWIHIKTKSYKVLYRMTIFTAMFSFIFCTALKPWTLSQCHSWCTASWEGASFVPSWGTSCWWCPQPQTTGCSTACPAALPTRACGGTACRANVTCRLTALVSMKYHLNIPLRPSNSPLSLGLLIWI